MNLKGIEGDYNIGLDIGTGSVGWAVTDADGNLCRKGGKPTWGSRLFNEGQTAAETRIHRGQRRRIIRRRWRLNLLQDFFADEIAHTDPGFFIRLNQSRLLPEDRDSEHSDYRWPIFNDTNFTEKDYYKLYPTIFHLRKRLIDNPEVADIRLVYLALHNIVKHRGNFLYQDNPSLSAKHSNIKEMVFYLFEALTKWCEIKGLVLSDTSKEIGDILTNRSDSRAKVAEKLKASFKISGSDTKALSNQAVNLANALVGYKTDFNKVFMKDPNDDVKYGDASFNLNEEDKYNALLEQIDDDDAPLLEALKRTYSAFILSGMVTEKWLSHSKVEEYKNYNKDLKTLKALVKEYVPEEYNSFFRGPVYEGTQKYDVSKAKGYTRYNLGEHKIGSNPGIKTMGYTEFQSAVKILFENTKAVEDERYQGMMSRFTEGRFLRRLRTSDNGVIPYQFNLEEMTAIIENQGKHYPFLLANQEKIESLVSFRIPYYIGPLTLKNAPKDAKGDNRFAWASRLPGRENTKITPWNWMKVIDKHQSAADFIGRMTGTCTYLYNEPVLPKESLLYQEYCVLNELNGAHWSNGDGKEKRFSSEYRDNIFTDLFKRGKVTYKRVEDWLKQRGFENAEVTGGQGKKGFESRLSSYIFFTKDVFGVDDLSPEQYVMAEELILWSTIFEDRSILREQIQKQYGDRLTTEQIKAVSKNRFTGWGRLSRKLLNGIESNNDYAPQTIIEIMRDGNNAYSRRTPLTLQEILHNDDLGFKVTIDEHNSELISAEAELGINALDGSPALRRQINQAVRIVNEITHIAGKTPKNIYIEVTRNEDPKKKGQTTKKRRDRIEKALKEMGAEAREILRELNDYPKISDEKLTLYFMQNGKSIYSGRPLDINHLSLYQVDHIIPQSYIKDDSFDNKVLVLPEENQSKGDSLLISHSVRENMKGYWSDLHKAKLISDKKYRNLMRSRISDNQLKGFIERQLVQTGQIAKFIQPILHRIYPETNIRTVKAAISSELRHACNLVKCREANDYHHAHDAFLACQIGRFIEIRHPDIYDNPIKMAKTVRRIAKQQADAARRGSRTSNSSALVQSFLSPGFDIETGEILRDEWDPDYEIGRIRKYFGYNDCFVTRKTEIGSGAFWDTTIYSPRIPKTLIPTKQNLNTEKYGGYSRKATAYYTLYAVRTDNKPTKTKLIGIPIQLSPSIKDNAQALIRFICETENSTPDKIQILRKRIMKYQKIKFGDDEYIINGIKQIDSARDLLLLPDDLTTINNLEDESEKIAFEKMNVLYEHLLDKLGLLCSEHLSIKNRILNSGITFSADMDYQKRRQFLLNLIAYIRGKTPRINLSLFGDKEHAGAISINKILKKPEQIVFIDQSITGMFETRTPVVV